MNADPLITLRMWHHGTPGQWHTVSEDFHERLIKFLNVKHAIPNTPWDVQIEYR